MKVEITDEMVNRAWMKIPEGPDCLDKLVLRAALDAALNPPPEPEIVVTDEMLKAGVDTYPESMRLDPSTRTMAELACGRIYRVMAKLACGRIYRAMERERRRAEKAAQIPRAWF